MTTRVTTHILDSVTGLPAVGVLVILSSQSVEVARTVSNADGRIEGFQVESSSVCVLRFETGDYFAGRSIRAFYPYVEVCFETAGEDHYHVPLLLGPFGYTTYRGT